MPLLNEMTQADRKRFKRATAELDPTEVKSLLAIMQSDKASPKDMMVRVADRSSDPRGMKLWSDFQAMSPEKQAETAAAEREAMALVRRLYSPPAAAKPQAAAQSPTPVPQEQSKPTAPGRNGLLTVLDKLNQAAGVADYYAMGIPSTMAGLVNAAIPGQPLGGLDEARAASGRARADAAQTSLGRDLLAMPEAMGGMVPEAVRRGVSGGARLMGAAAGPQPGPPPGPPPRGLLQGTPNVYQKPGEYFPNEIKGPQGPPPVPPVSPRTANVDHYSTLYQQDMPGEGGRALIDRVGSNKINQPIFSDTKRYAPHELAQIKARVAAGDADAAAQWQQLKEAAAKQWGLDLDTMKPLGPQNQ